MRVACGSRLSRALFKGWEYADGEDMLIVVDCDSNAYKLGIVTDNDRIYGLTSGGGKLQCSEFQVTKAYS